MRIDAPRIAQFRAIFDGFEANGLRVMLNAADEHAYVPLAKSDEERLSLARFVRGDIVEAVSGSPIGVISRDLALDGGTLVVLQHVLRLKPAYKRRGFGSALHKHSEERYRAMGVQEVRAEVEGDGSLFLARRNFDFNLADYAKSSWFQGFSGEALRARILYLSLNFTGSTVSTDPIARLSEHRPGPVEILNAIAEASTKGRLAAEEFRARQPPAPDRLSEHGQRFRTPQDIERFAKDEIVEGLPPGLGLGQAVLAGMRWRARKFLELA